MEFSLIIIILLASNLPQGGAQAALVGSTPDQGGGARLGAGSRDAYTRCGGAQGCMLSDLDVRHERGKRSVVGLLFGQKGCCVVSERQRSRSWASWYQLARGMPNFLRDL